MPGQFGALSKSVKNAVCYNTVSVRRAQIVWSKRIVACGGSRMKTDGRWENGTSGAQDSTCLFASLPQRASRALAVVNHCQRRSRRSTIARGTRTPLFSFLCFVNWCCSHTTVIPRKMCFVVPVQQVHTGIASQHRRDPCLTNPVAVFFSNYGALAWWKAMIFA